MTRTLALLASISTSLAFAADSGLEIRFYPAAAHTYALASERGVSSLLIQNTAIVNRGARPVTVTSVDYEIRSGPAPVETRSLGPADIARSVAGGQALQSSGMLEMLAFQFGGEKLLPRGTKLGASATLAPGEALYFGPQVFALRGGRTEAHVRVAALMGEQSVEASGSLAIAGESRNEYRLPLAGTWLVGAGATLHSHHRWVVPQEFAFDLLKTGADGATHSGQGTQRSDYFAYGQPVMAAAAGKVTIAIGDEAESDEDFIKPGEAQDAYFDRVKQTQMKRLARGARGVVGNHVVIAHDNGEYSVYAHLKPGSVAVKAGDTVTAGQRIAAVGTTGNSTEPHLHFHVCDGPDPMMCAGIPVKFANLSIRLADFPRPPQTGDYVSNP